MTVSRTCASFAAWAFSIGTCTANSNSCRSACPGRYNKAVWLDYDHDYDLDLFLLAREYQCWRARDGAAGFSDETARFPFAKGTLSMALRSTSSRMPLDLTWRFPIKIGAASFTATGWPDVTKPVPRCVAGRIHRPGRAGRGS